MNSGEGEGEQFHCTQSQTHSVDWNSSNSLNWCSAFIFEYVFFLKENKVKDVIATEIICSLVVVE